MYRHSVRLFTIRRKGNRIYISMQVTCLYTMPSQGNTKNDKKIKPPFSKSIGYAPHLCRFRHKPPRHSDVSVGAVQPLSKINQSIIHLCPHLHETDHPAYAFYDKSEKQRLLLPIHQPKGQVHYTCAGQPILLYRLVHGKSSQISCIVLNHCMFSVYCASQCIKKGSYSEPNQPLRLLPYPRFLLVFRLNSFPAPSFFSRFPSSRYMRCLFVIAHPPRLPASAHTGQACGGGCRTMPACGERCGLYVRKVWESDHNGKNSY